jgi:hypothetical protein
VSPTLSAGGSQTCTLSVTSIDGFSGAVNISITGLPAGVTVSPATTTVTTGAPQQVVFNASSAATVGTANLTLQASSGSLNHTSQMALSLTTPVTGAHPSIRTRYLRTNSSYYGLQNAPPHFTLYDATHRQFFVSNPYMNEIDVFDAVQEVETAQISVPSAWGLDISPYNGSIYAGTLLGDIYQINTSTLTVTQRFPASTIGPNGYAATTALVLSDGRLALQGGAGGILGVDGFGGIAVWDPTTNSLDTGPSTIYGSICAQASGGAFNLSGDRTLILSTWVDSGGGGDPVCSYDPVARVETYGNFPSGSSVRQIIPTPDGSRFFLTSAEDGVAVFDAKTAKLVGQISGTQDYTVLPSGSSGAVLSIDGKTLYLINEVTGAVGAFDTTSYQQTGWIPSFEVMDSQPTPVIGAIDETGLIVGAIGHGTSFLDATQMKSTQPTSLTMNFVSPSTGPVSGGTTVPKITSFNAGSVSVSQAYVGSSAVPSSVPSGYVQVTTPMASQAGPVDLGVVLSDGGAGIAPEGFSYGPTILEVTPNGATAEGGHLGALIGYGFGSTTSGVQVTVGGLNAPVTVVHSGPPISPYPFPTQALQFTIPPGAAGSVADVTVTTASGSATAKAAFHYVAAAQSFPTAASLQSGIYDAHRDLYYFTDQAQIQVLSKMSGWQSPIPLPGTTTKSRLQALSESPDGSKLAVSDITGQAIYVLNPDEPASVQRFSMPIDYLNISLLGPSGLAVTNDGSVYFAAADLGGTGTPAFYKLVTSTGTINSLGTVSSGSSSDSFARVLLSPDGSKAYSAIEGLSFWVDTSNDQIYRSARTSRNDGGEPDLAVSADGSTVYINGAYLTDSALNAESMPEYIDWETWFPSSTYGNKLNQDGSLLLQPLTDGIDLLSRNSGRLLYRVQIPGTTADVYDSLVMGGEDTVGVITTTGVSFVDLSSLPVPSGATQLFPDAVFASEHPQNTEAAPAGTNLTLSGQRRMLRTRSGGPEMKSN